MFMSLKAYLIVQRFSSLGLYILGKPSQGQVKTIHRGIYGGYLMFNCYFKKVYYRYVNLLSFLIL